MPEIIRYLEKKIKKVQKNKWRKDFLQNERIIQGPDFDEGDS